MLPYTLIELESVDSTNDYLKRHKTDEEAPITLVTAEFQTAGKGQRGNSWESETGKNVVYSLMVHPRTIKPSQMFSISEVAALSVCEALNEYLNAEQKEQTDGGFCVKWPNDIYYGNQKVAGILIETDLMGGRIDNAIIGVGININQREFVSDAPNPISLWQIKGEETNRQEVLESIMKHFTCLYEQLEKGELDTLHQHFMQQLYRKSGMHTYRDEQGTFEAIIADVELSGHLILKDESGTLRRYAFKEVSFCLPSLTERM